MSVRRWQGSKGSARLSLSSRVDVVSLSPRTASRYRQKSLSIIRTEGKNEREMDYVTKQRGAEYVSPSRARESKDDVNGLADERGSPGVMSSTANPTKSSRQLGRS